MFQVAGGAARRIRRHTARRHSSRQRMQRAASRRSVQAAAHRHHGPRMARRRIGGRRGRRLPACARRVVAAASIRRWRAGGVSRPALPSSGLPGVIDATCSVSSLAACATGGGVAHTSATSAYRRATTVREAASSWSFRSFRGRRRAAAASIVGTTQAACHAGIRRHGHGRWHGRRWTQRARRSVTVRMFGCRRAKRPPPGGGGRATGWRAGGVRARTWRAARRCGSPQRGGERGRRAACGRRGEASGVVGGHHGLRRHAQDRRASWRSTCVIAAPNSTRR